MPEYVVIDGKASHERLEVFAADGSYLIHCHDSHFIT